jgi:hypothetical protein
VAKVQIVTTKAFRRERWWFTLGLVGLTLAVLLPYAIPAFMRPARPYESATHDFWIFVVVSGAFGMGVAGFVAYTLTKRLAAPPASGRAWAVLIHLVVVPLVAFTIAWIAFGPYALIQWNQSLLAATPPRNVLVYAAIIGTMALGIPCLVVTAVWSAFFLYVIRPKYAIVEERDPASP